ncbi:molecular chaperone TorD family protein [Halarcobacter sp.]|uniref:TorD/DmsD family molecular chaperone n=1 Tax=Halarcobacter sp. TaxID=2321133 RepID=UPI0029F4C995|nr:molecular chaperone TorD family protein [Halarcobacter sp.]
MIDNERLNRARVLYYGLFSSLFSFIDSKSDYEKVVHTIEFLSENPIDENSKVAFENIKKYFDEKGYNGLKEENNNLFFSPSTTFIPVTASYYEEDRDDGQKRVEMTNYVLKSNFRKDSENFKEAEDHISFIFEFLQKVIEQDIQKDKNQLVIDVFANILNGIIDRFIENIYFHESSSFYKNIAVVLKVFIELERVYLDVKKLESTKTRVQQDLFHQKKKGFTKRAKRNFDEVTSL